MAQSWLVPQLTGSSALPGLVAAAQSLPVLLWLIFVLAGALGTVNSVDQPGRQTFVPEIVDRDGVQNAAGLNSVLDQRLACGRPCDRGLLIATAGVGVRFLASPVSLAVLVAPARIRAEALHPASAAGRQAGQLRQGLMMVLVGTLAYEFPVTLLLLARVSLHGGASTYRFLTAATGAGAVAGGLVVAAWPGPACCPSRGPRSAPG